MASRKKMDMRNVKKRLVLAKKELDAAYAACIKAAALKRTQVLWGMEPSPEEYAAWEYAHNLFVAKRWTYVDLQAHMAEKFPQFRTWKRKGDIVEAVWYVEWHRAAEWLFKAEQAGLFP